MRTKEGNKDIAILEASIRVFAQYGYHDSKMHKIAEEAGVAIGSIYLYYKNKETILLKIFSQLWERLFNEFKSTAQRTDIQADGKFDAMIDLLFDVFIKDPALALVFVNEQSQLIQRQGKDFTGYYEKFLNLGEEIVREGCRQKIFNPEIDIKIVRTFIFGGLRELLHQWASSPKTYSLISIRRNVKYLTKHGLLLPQGVNYSHATMEAQE